MRKKHTMAHKSLTPIIDACITWKSTDSLMRQLDGELQAGEASVW